MRDDRLAGRAARGDRHAFAELYRRHHQRLYRYCLSLVGDPEDAADALQGTMAKALSSLERGETVKNVRPWLFRIAHNAAIDLIRLRRHRAPVEEIEEIESSALTAPSAASQAQSREELAEVVSDIRGLPERQGSALVMRELSELSYVEIAGALETSPLAARQLVHQARTLLHDNRAGRTMDCYAVRQALDETDGRRPRDRRIRAHLSACRDCEAYRRSIRSRRSALAALAPPLTPTAASEIFAGLFPSSSSPGMALAAGGLTAGAAKLAGSSGIVKAAAALAAGAFAVAAVGGAVVAGGALLGPDDEGLRAAAPGDADAALRPDLPALRPMPSPAQRPNAAKGGDEDGETDEPGSPAGPSGEGLPSADLAQSDPPVDLATVEKSADSTETLASTDGAGVDLGIDVPDGSSEPAVGDIDLPGDSAGSGVEVPDIDSPGDSGGPDVEIPDVEVPDVEIPEVDVPGGSDGPGVELPDVDLPGDSDGPEIPDVDVEVPSGSDGPGGIDVEVPEPDVEVPDAGLAG